MASPATQLPVFDFTLRDFFTPGQRKSRLNLHHLEQLRQLVVSLHRNPSLAQEAWKVGLVPKLIEFSECGMTEFEQQARMALSLLGHAPPYSGRGIRILSVDGGGTRLVSRTYKINK